MHVHLRPSFRQDRNTKVCMWGDVSDVITRVEFDVVRFTGF